MPKTPRAQKKRRTDALRQAVETRRVGRRVSEPPEPEVASADAPLETGDKTTATGSSMETIRSKDQTVTPKPGDMLFDNKIDNVCNMLEDSCSGPMLAAHVSVSIKEKIWANEFVEFQSLLKKSPSEVCKQKFQLVNGELVLSSKEDLPKFTERIEPWSDAFVIFMSIYIEKHPTETRNLLQYFHNIRLASVKFTGWLNYDRQFRLKKSIYTSLSWQSVDPELWMLFMQPLQSNVSTYRPCYAFNQKGFCTGKTCQYTHTCQKCQGHHPAISCSYVYGQNVPRIIRPHSSNMVRGHYMTPRYPANRFREPFTASRPLGKRPAYGQPLGSRPLPY